MCLFEECNEGDVLFKTVDEWLSHMKWQHTVVWSCQAPGHEQNIYDSQEELEEHIRLEHLHFFTANQLPHLVKQGAQPVSDTFGALAYSYSPDDLSGRQAHLCPICRNFPLLSSAVNPDLSESKMQPDIQNHILEHLESIALLSLPAIEDVDAVKSEIPQSSDGNSIVKDAVDLRLAFFNNEFYSRESQQQTLVSNSDLADAVPPAPGCEEDWSAFFRQVKDSHLPESIGGLIPLQFSDQTRPTLFQSDPASQSDEMDIIDLFKDRRLLYEASYNGDENIVRRVLQKGTDLNVQDISYRNALQAAAYKGHLSVVQILLENDTGISFRSDHYDASARRGQYGNALLAAASRGHMDVVKFLLDNGENVNLEGGWYGSPLQGASYHRRLGIVKILLDRGTDVNSQGGYHGSALQAASYAGDINIVQLLLEKGADVNARGGKYGSALQAASVAGNKNSIQLLLDRGVDINVQGGEHGSALRAALYAGHKSIAKLLLDNGADIHGQSGFGSPLLVAAALGNNEIVRELVERGADPDASLDVDQTPLSLAAYCGQDEVVKVLLETGRVKVDSKDVSDATPLSWASSKGHTD